MVFPLTSQPVSRPPERLVLPRIPCSQAPRPVLQHCSARRRGLRRVCSQAAVLDTEDTAESSSDIEAGQHQYECLQTIDLDPVAEGEYCMPAQITVNNRDNPRFTILDVEVKEFPGLLRVVAWVLNGLELVVENARLVTDEDGLARNTFWLADYAGRKLPDEMAELVAERVGDFVIYCTPDARAVQAQRFTNGPIMIDNSDHEQYTVVTVTGERLGGGKQGFLLELASVITGLGVSIHEAVIQGCTSCGGPEISKEYNYAEQGRLFKFWVTDRYQKKLDYSRATGLLYTLGLVIGKSNAPIRPPGSDRVENGTATASP